MIKLVAITLMTFTLCIANAQSKKEQIENLNYKLDSLTEIMTNERQIFKKEINEKGIKISALQDQIDQLNLRNEALSTQLTQEREKILILENEYSLTSDSVDILKQKIIELNRNNSLKAIRNSSEFETFLNYFLSTVYSEKNIDSLIYVSSPLIMDFVDQKIGFGRFWNRGAHCNLYNSGDFDYYFDEGYFGRTEPKTSNLPFFENQEPEGGFCDEASSPNGIYFRQVNNLPEDTDLETGESIPPPLMLKHLKKMAVQVQFDYWIYKTLYFVELNNKWFLLYINDCDCSA